MPPAAKVGDVTSHGGTIVGPGVPNVLIGGMPAAVATDLHVCAIPIIVHPLAVSIFPMGSTTVLIGGRPALRIQDLSLCGANSVIGEPTVLIG